MNLLFIVYDNGSHLPVYPVNYLYLMAAGDQKHDSIGLWQQDLSHGSLDAMKTDVIDEYDWDAVGLGFVAGYYQYEKAMEISKAVNECKTRKSFLYVLGGHGPAADPGYFIDKMGADTVVVGAGEEAIHNLKPGVIHGEMPTFERDLVPVYNKIPMDVYRRTRFPTSQNADFCHQVLSSRGCKYNCSFCYRMDDGFYERPVDAIMQEIRLLHDDYAITHFQFADELLMSSERRTAEICVAILSSDISIKWDCNGRLNTAKPDILRLMKKAGCEYINYGIESLDQKILNDMKKGLTVGRIHDGVEATLEAGLVPGLNFIWGFPGDTVENLDAAAGFLLEYDTCHELRTIRPVTPYPGTPLFNRAISEGWIKDTADFYERVHYNSDAFCEGQPEAWMDQASDDAHRSLKSANLALITNYYDTLRDKTKTAAKTFYDDTRKPFRGFRPV